MKKHLILLFSTLLLASCGGSNEPSEEPEVLLDGFNARVVDSSNAPIENAFVQWCEESNCFQAKTNARGLANYPKAVEGTNYQIHVELPASLEDSLTYNPNTFFQSSSSSVKLLPMNDLLHPTNGDGGAYTSYEIGEGIYRAEVDGTKPVFYGFTPKRPGVYKLETWARNDEPIDPILHYIGNAGAFINATEHNKIDGSIDGSKNETVEIEVLEDAFDISESGVMTAKCSYYFALTAKKAATYDFQIKFARPVDEEENNVDVVEANDVASAAFVDTGVALEKFNLNESIDELVYSNVDHFYHVGSADGKLVLVNIKSSNDWGYGNFFSMVDPENELSGVILLDNGTKLYNQFICSYAEKCSELGVYPLNQELKAFLELYSNDAGNWAFISSGTGFPSNPGTAAKVLFACSYYAD